MSIIHEESSDGYGAALDAQNKHLDEQLASIRARQESGDISIREAADERIRVMTRSSDRVAPLAAQALRRREWPDMSEQPAERLARMKREHPLWSIRHVSQGLGWTAHRGGQRLWAGTLTDMRTQLDAANRRLLD